MRSGEVIGSILSCGRRGPGARLPLPASTHACSALCKLGLLNDSLLLMAGSFQSNRRQHDYRGFGKGDGEGATTPSVRSPEVAGPFERSVLVFGFEVVLPLPATPSVGVVGARAVPVLFTREPGPGRGDEGPPATPSVGVVGPVAMSARRTGFFFFLGNFFGAVESA